MCIIFMYVRILITIIKYFLSHAMGLYKSHRKIRSWCYNYNLSQQWVRFFCILGFFHNPSNQSSFLHLRDKVYHRVIFDWKLWKINCHFLWNIVYHLHLYSLVETAKANNLNVFQYIYTLLLYMPGYKSGSAGIEQLLPWSDFIKEHCSGLINVETITVEEHPELSFD